jgi:hypothetical protein
MAGTRRVPLSRVTNTPTITARAVEIFDRMEQRQRARRRAADCVLDEANLCTEECKSCTQWRALHSELHKELGLPPWRWPAVCHNPHPPTSPDGVAWLREIADSDSEPDALHRSLRAASKATARARRAADGVATEAAT